MRMGNDDASQMLASIGDELGVRHHHGISVKHDAAVHHQPATAMAIEVKVHADFATAAKRQEPEVRCGWG